MSQKTANTSYDRLLTTVEQVAGRLLTSLDPALLDEPVCLQATLADHLVGTATKVIVTGTHDRRLLLVERGGRSWLAADLSGQPHATRAWPTWVSGRIEISTPDRWLSGAMITHEAVDRLTRPRVLLVALYHPEFFPLPRFPLGISDLARAARATLLGQVELMDMQRHRLRRWASRRRDGSNQPVSPHRHRREPASQRQLPRAGPAGRHLPA